MKTSAALSLIAILAVPVLQLLASPAWMFTPDGFDAWFYHGFFINLKSHITAFSGSYYATRLAWILPGYLAHTLFSPVVANFLLRLYICWIATLSTYFFVQRSYGRRCATVCAFLLAASPQFLAAAGWDYVDGAGIAYGLLCVEELGAAAAALQRSRRAAVWRAGFAGAAFAAAVHTNFFLGILAPVLALVFLPRAGRSGLFLILPAAGGSVVLTGLFGAVNRGLGGDFLFFTPSLSFGVGLMKTDTYFVKPSVWIAQATWLAVPAAITVASLIAVVWLVANRRPAPDQTPRPVWIADGLAAPLLFLIFATLTALKNPILQLPFYSSYMMVVAPISAAALIGRRLDVWLPRHFALLAAAGALLALVVGADLPGHLPAPLAATYVSLRAVLILSPYTLAGVLAAGIVAASAIPDRRIATAVVGAALGIVLIRLGDITLRETTGGATGRAIYLDVDRIARELTKQTAGESLWFWYPYKPEGHQHYTSVASTHLWATRLLGRHMPADGDLRVDVFRHGLYIALMDDRQENVDQAAEVLRKRGVGLLSVARLRPSVMPNSFGVALFRIGSLDLPPKVTGTPPPAESVRPVVELLAYGFDDAIARTSRAFYGKPLLPAPTLPAGVIKSTDIKDHCATNFLPVDQLAAPVTAVEVSVTDQPADVQYGPVSMIFQDQDYGVLYWTGTLAKGDDRTLVPLPAGTKGVRIAFLVNGLGYIRFPKSVRLRAFTPK